MIIAISFAIKSNQREILERIFSNVLRTKPVITDLQTHTLSCSPIDTLLVFGNRARKLIKENSGRIIDLPELSKLEPETCNEGIRNEVYEKLCQLRAELDSSVTLTAESLPNLSTSAIEALEMSLRAKGETTWHGITQDNRSICLSLVTNPQTNAELVLTFAELFTLRAAMETLQVKEISIGRVGKGNSICNHK